VPDLTVADVATRLTVTPLTVRRWLRSGSLAGVACDDRATCRIREPDLATFLDARRRGGVQERPRRPVLVV
jgi:excisionase family DNA binding protein